MSELDKFFEIAASDTELQAQFKRASDPKEFARLAVEHGKKQGFAFGQDEVLKYIALDMDITRKNLKKAQSLGIREIGLSAIGLRQWENAPDALRKDLKQT